MSDDDDTGGGGGWCVCVYMELTISWLLQIKLALFSFKAHLRHHGNQFEELNIDYTG